jgi:hypothetical protein
MRSKRQRRALAPAIVELRGRMEHWRKTRKSKKPMPPELWQAAVAVACEHGVFAVSSELRLNYNTLKARVKEVQRSAKRAETDFVELKLAPLPEAAPAAGLEVEFVRACGDKMIMRLPAAQAGELAALARAFWSCEK